MKVYLLKDVAKLGQRDEVVDVKPGFAHNYLIPQGIAVAATPSVMKQYEETIRQRAHKEAKKIEDAKALAAKIVKLVPEVAVKVSESGSIYGSVTTALIADAFAKLGVEVDKKNIVIISSDVDVLGEYEARVKCYKEVNADFTFKVVAEEA